MTSVPLADNVKLHLVSFDAIRLPYTVIALPGFLITSLVSVNTHKPNTHTVCCQIFLSLYAWPVRKRLLERASRSGNTIPPPQPPFLRLYICPVAVSVSEIMACSVQPKMRHCHRHPGSGEAPTPHPLSHPPSPSPHLH